MTEAPRKVLEEMRKEKFHATLVLDNDLDVTPGGAIDVFPRAAPLEQLSSLLLVQGTLEGTGAVVVGGCRRNAASPPWRSST